MVRKDDITPPVRSGFEQVVGVSSPNVFFGNPEWKVWTKMRVVSSGPDQRYLLTHQPRHVSLRVRTTSGSVRRGNREMMLIIVPTLFIKHV